jgi:hypothetical protein
MGARRIVGFGLAVVATAAVAVAVVTSAGGPSGASAAGSDAAAAVAYANQNGYRSSIAVLDTDSGQFWGAGDYDSTYASESVVKVFIATELLVSGQMTGWVASTAWTMITQSDDASADALYGRVGGDSVITWVEQYYGIPNLGSPPIRAGWWGSTQITAHGMVELYQRLKADPSVWPWLSSAMHNAATYGSDGTYQFFGLPSATTGAAIKQGWGDDDAAGQPDRYAVAILTQGPGYGAPISNMLTAEARLLMPGGRIRNGLSSPATPALARFSDGTWTFYSTDVANGAGVTDRIVSWPGTAATDIPVVGDWTGTGVQSPGLLRFSGDTWTLYETTVTNGVGVTDLIVTWAGTLASDVPMIGDWTGSGRQTLGLARFSGDTWTLYETDVASGAAVTDRYVTWAGTAATDVPLVGDWTGTGVQRFGLARFGGSTWTLYDTDVVNGPAVTYRLVSWPGTAATDVPLVGDWTDTGVQTFGLDRFAGGTWTLYDTDVANGTGVTYRYVTWAGTAATDTALVGSWT